MIVSIMMFVFIDHMQIECFLDFRQLYCEYCFELSEEVLS
jgi:hypothetical protein